MAHVQDNLRPVIYYLKHMMQDMDEEKMLSRALISYAAWRIWEIWEIWEIWGGKWMESMVIYPDLWISCIYICINAYHQHVKVYICVFFPIDMETHIFF